MTIRGVSINGDWVVDSATVKNEFYNHFASTFEAPPTYRLIFSGDFPYSLNHEQSSLLEWDVTDVEIRRAIWDCGVDKSPGPDGFTFEFIQKIWDLVGMDVCRAVKAFFISSQFPKGCNPSFIALIPKIMDVKLVKEFRPISLIGCQYKIVGKILVNCLSMVIGDLISMEQSAFVRGRQILDGPMILSEVIAWCNHKKNKTMIFKVDFEKAYDSVRWDFLDDIMQQFGFGEKWKGWIMGCLNSSTGSVLVNGSPTKEFKFHRGLCQGHAFSSFYADDAMFIREWNDFNLHNIVQILQCFYLASGLQINLHKCSLLGIGGVKYEEVVRRADIIGCEASKTPFKYLGVQVGSSMSRLQDWDIVVDKIVAKLSKWKVKNLSIGGRLTLLKSVLGSLPTYYFSLYKVPNGVLKKLESLRSNFFRGSEMGERKIAWVSWDTVLANKEQISVQEKMVNGLQSSLQRDPRGGAENTQMEYLSQALNSVKLRDEPDRWIWELDVTGCFSVASVRRYIEDQMCVRRGSPTRWLRLVPIKVNVFAWRLALNKLPTKLNMSYERLVALDQLIEDKENGKGLLGSYLLDYLVAHLDLSQ
ncbi:RNA-directed DNA polymerase, eukaryota [Tanacetum coccineum]